MSEIGAFFFKNNLDVLLSQPLAWDVFSNGDEKRIYTPLVMFWLHSEINIESASSCYDPHKKESLRPD